MTNAIVRPPAQSITRAINSWYAKKHSRKELIIDYDKARWQHQQFVNLLERLGLRVFLLHPDERFPDGCFTQDPVVVAGHEALVVPMKVQSRGGEHEAIADKLSSLSFALVNAERGTCDGGDLVVAEEAKHLWIGKSARTDEDGVRTVEEFYSKHGYTVEPVPVIDCLHLGTGLSYLGEDRLLISDWVNQEAQEMLAGKQRLNGGRVQTRRRALIKVPAEESSTANVLVFNKTIVMADGYPYTKRMLERFGYSVLTTPISEFEKADGSISCLTLLFDL